MAPTYIPSPGEAWASSLTSLAAAYGVDESTMAQRVYAMSEQIHQAYCLSRGIVNHNESRPDQHVAIRVLGMLAGSDWWLVRGSDRVSVIAEQARQKVHLIIEEMREANMSEEAIRDLAESLRPDDTFVYADGKTVHITDDETEGGYGPVVDRPDIP